MMHEFCSHCDVRKTSLFEINQQLADQMENLRAENKNLKSLFKYYESADVAEVVRCKDCKHARHWYGNDTFGNTAYLCDYFIDGEEIKMFPEDFCSRGEVMDAAEDGDIKIYDPKTQHINADLADRCNHGPRD